MERQRHQRVSELLHQAFELPPGDRLTFLREQCESDELFDEARSLLEHVPASEADPPHSPITLRPDQAEESLAGRYVGRFRVIDEVGRGGMGVVWRAHDPLLKRTVAIKFLPASLAGSPQARERFLREARAASALDHAAVATIYDFGEADGRFFIALRFVDGQTVAQVRKQGPADPMTALRVVRDVATALSHAHERGVLHRDVSPGNIMITPDGHGILLDFGLAASVGSAHSGPVHGGTPNYIAPEVMAGEVPDRRSDIFALGVVLYEMLTGRHPFPRHAIAAHSRDRTLPTPASPSSLVSGLPAGVDDIVLKTISPDATLRPQTAADLAARLDATIHRAVRSGSKRWIVYAGLGLALTTAAVYVVTGNRRPASVADPLLAVWDVAGTDSLKTATLQSLLQTGLTENSPCRVISQARVEAIGQTAKRENDPRSAADLAREAGATTVLLAGVTAPAADVVVEWRLLETRSGRELRHGIVDGSDMIATADSIIRAAVPEIARHGGLPTAPGKLRALATMTTSSAAAYEAYAETSSETTEEGMVKRLEKAVDIDSTFALASFELSRMYRELRDDASARTSADLAWRHRARLSLRDRLRLEGWRERLIMNGTNAMKMYEEMLERWPDDRDMLMELCQANWWYWYWSRSLHYAEEGHKLYPDDKYFLAMVIHGRTITERAADAIAPAREQVRRLSEYNSWDDLANVYIALSMYDSALVALEKGMRIDPNPASFAESQMRIAYLKGDLEGAIALAEARAANPDLSPLDRYIALTSAGLGTRHGVALLYLHAGRYRDALALVRRETTRTGSGPNVIGRDVNLCNFLSRVGRHEEALAFIEEARSTSEWAADPLAAKYNRPDGEINSLVALGRFDEARAILDENAKRAEVTMKLIPPHHYFCRTRLAVAEGQPEVALAHLEKAIEFGMIPGEMDTEYHMLRAQACRAARRFDEAERMLRYLIRHFPSVRVAHYHLARVLEDQGRIEEATTEYGRFLDLWSRADPDRPEVIGARERLMALRSD